jgi:hypothetical protein
MFELGMSGFDGAKKSYGEMSDSWQEGHRVKAVGHAIKMGVRPVAGLLTVPLPLITRTGVTLASAAAAVGSVAKLGKDGATKVFRKVHKPTGKPEVAQTRSEKLAAKKDKHEDLYIGSLAAETGPIKFISGRPLGYGRY